MAADLIAIYDKLSVDADAKKSASYEADLANVKDGLNILQRLGYVTAELDHTASSFVLYSMARTAESQKRPAIQYKLATPSISHLPVLLYPMWPHIVYSTLLTDLAESGAESKAEQKKLFIELRVILKKIVASPAIYKICKEAVEGLFGFTLTLVKKYPVEDIELTTLNKLVINSDTTVATSCGYMFNIIELIRSGFKKGVLGKIEAKDSTIFFAKPKLENPFTRQEFSPLDICHIINKAIALQQKLKHNGDNSNPYLDKFLAELGNLEKLGSAVYKNSTIFILDKEGRVLSIYAIDDADLSKISDQNKGYLKSFIRARKLLHDDPGFLSKLQSEDQNAAWRVINPVKNSVEVFATSRTNCSVM